MKRLLLILLLALALTLTSALTSALASTVGTPQDFAALSVRPNGPEELDLATGITTLPEGGEIVYRTAGVTLTGSYIRFLEGDFIEVRGASVTGAFGVLEALELRFEVQTQRLVARGATFLGEVVELHADTAELELSEDVAVLSGSVTSTDPDFGGERALVDLTGQQALLVGPYTFRDGPVALRGGTGKLLALHWDAAGALAAETQIPAVLKMRFADWLP